MIVPSDLLQKGSHKLPEIPLFLQGFDWPMCCGVWTNFRCWRAAVLPVSTCVAQTSVIIWRIVTECGVHSSKVPVPKP
jgi:hypothetical protein